VSSPFRLRIVVVPLLLVLFAGACADDARVDAENAAQDVDGELTAEEAIARGEEGGTTTTEGRDLFAESTPRLHPMAPGFGDLGPERPVPDFCRPVAAGLERDGDGFLLVVQMEGEIPALDAPPALPFGVLLHILELDVGIFVPGTELGGSYRMMRQYQVPDRPELELGRIADGKSEQIEEVDVDLRGREMRVALPDAGSRTPDVGEWAVRVSCALRHPVDSFYFPASRLPATPPTRLPL
jgi:hypothetical protein